MIRPRRALSVRILRGTNVINTFSSTNNAAGTNAGLNTVLWDGSTDNGSNLAVRTFTPSHHRRLRRL